MTNEQIAGVFDQLADLLEIQGANPFRLRAYRSAARTIRSSAESFRTLVEEGADLTAFPGIGQDLARQITELVQTGEHPKLKELRQTIPPGVVDMLRLPGIGPKKVSVFFRELGLTSLDDLKAAAAAGKISELKGFGPKIEQTILENVDRAAAAGQRVLISVARSAAETVAGDLGRLEGVTRAAVAGSCRRRRETCGDLDILVTCDDSRIPMDALADHPLVEHVLQRGDTRQRVRLTSGLEMDLRVVPDDSWGAALQYFTGSKEHNVVLRQRAKDRGLKLNEYGVFRDEQQVAGSDEAEVYAALGLPWIPPELRENRGEIEAAESGHLPVLVTVDDIQGDLHLHTTASDGTASVREMAEAARDRGLTYIAVTDHSQRVSMAHGLNADRLRRHWEEIRRVNEQIDGIELLCGIECDILEDASMDLDDDVLAEADWVVGVLHYGLNQPRDQIMKRLLHAIRHPHVDAIGHPTGRLVNRRAGADVNMPEILQAAADFGVMMEINASPKRLDLDDIHAAAAREWNVPIVISTDAHSVAGFDVLPYGVDQARRAWLTRDDVANTRSWPEFRKLLKKR